jgi:catechol 2,3-dioxygenase-like lactoylglutathione lyase family enzyme
VQLETALLFCEMLWGRETLACILNRPAISPHLPNPTMKPYISLITLGVSDLARSTAFYRDGLGLPQEGDFDGVMFFKLRGTWLSLFPRDELAKDAGVSDVGSGFGGFSIAHNVSSTGEVDDVLARAQAAGAKLIKPAQEAFWGGYHGFFADPDGFVWEIAWNPGLDLT